MPWVPPPDPRGRRDEILACCPPQMCYIHAHSHTSMTTYNKWKAKTTRIFKKTSILTAGCWGTWTGSLHTFILLWPSCHAGEMNVVIVHRSPRHSPLWNLLFLGSHHNVEEFGAFLILWSEIMLLSPSYTAAASSDLMSRQSTSIWPRGVWIHIFLQWLSTSSWALSQSHWHVTEALAEMMGELKLSLVLALSQIQNSFSSKVSAKDLTSPLCYWDLLKWYL